MTDYDDSTTCDIEGMSGRCGEDCPVFLRGDCELEEEAIENIISEINDSESERVLESFDEAIQEMVENYLDDNIQVKQKNTVADFDRAMDIFN